MQEEAGVMMQIKNLKVCYKKIEVLTDISFSIREHEVLGLAGESGCGKSTLAKAASGLIKPSAGEITYSCGRPQMVFQDPYNSLNPVRKIGWILEEPLKIKGGYDKPERRKRVYSMLEKVGLEQDIADRYPNQLSGGQRQRAAIALALMLEPKLLIADEPVSALDVTIQSQIVDLLLRLKKEMGLSVLFISHDLRIIYQLCDRVMIMKEGKIVEQGDTQDVFFRPQHDYTKTLLDAANITGEE